MSAVMRIDRPTPRPAGVRPPGRPVRRRAIRPHLVVVGTVLLACASGAALRAERRPSAGPVRVKLATLAPKGTSFHHVLLAMGEQWRAAPEGGVALTVYTDGTMGNEPDMVRRMRVGQIQAAMLTATGLSQIDESVSALQNMPLIFRTLDEAEYVRERLRPELERRLREKGFVVLFWGDAGWVRFFSPRPALRPDDFKPLKMFAWAGDAKAIDLWKTAGFQPVPLEFADILTGLKTGLIEAVAVTPSYALAGQFYTSVPHMLDLHWAALVGATVIRADVWDGLKPATREALAVAAAEAGRQMQIRTRQENEESIEAMKQRGLTVHAVPADVERVWREAAEAFYPKIRGTIVPVELFDQVVRILEEYRAASGSSAP